MRDAQASREALSHLAEFASSGNLARLDRGRGLLQEQTVAWDHQSEVARRLGSPWPLPPSGESPWKVTRQDGRSQVLWRCPRCDWEVGWSVEADPWQQLEWPCAMECPLCDPAVREPENSSSDAPIPGGSPPTVFER